MKGLYAIVDTKSLALRKIDPVAYARALLQARPAALQLRAKDMPAREILALLRVINPMCRAAGVPLVANDRADLAVLAGCAMVHIGQQDLPYELVRRIAPELAIGISTHNMSELHRALMAKPCYVAYGPVFETATKANADPAVGIEGLRDACEVARAAGIPLVAIGGITLANAKGVSHWASACALISDLYPPGATLRGVTERAMQFQRIMGAFAYDVEATLRP